MVAPWPGWPAAGAGPGTNDKQDGFGLVDWRDGELDWQLAEGRRPAPLCDQLHRAAERSRSRGRIAM